MGTGCGLGKINYATRAEATEKTDGLRSKRGTAKVYYCEACGAYHITTKKKGKPYDRAEEKRRWKKKF